MSVFFCRPVAGYINICPKVLSDRTDLLIVTVKHELMHGLVSVSCLYLDEFVNIFKRESPRNFGDSLIIMIALLVAGFACSTLNKSTESNSLATQMLPGNIWRHH